MPTAPGSLKASTSADAPTTSRWRRSSTASDRRARTPKAASMQERADASRVTLGAHVTSERHGFSLGAGEQFAPASSAQRHPRVALGPGMTLREAGLETISREHVRRLDPYVPAQ